MKHLLQSAATLEGVDLTAFVLCAAAEKARRVLTDHAQIALSRSSAAMLNAESQHE